MVLQVPRLLPGALFDSVQYDWALPGLMHGRALGSLAEFAPVADWLAGLGPAGRVPRQAPRDHV